jgi:hypothetical protein
MIKIVIVIILNPDLEIDLGKDQSHRSGESNQVNCVNIKIKLGIIIVLKPD